MGWLLGCFKCTGDSQQGKSKKHSSGVANSVPGRTNSAAVAHATSPDDLHRVRKSPLNLAVASSNGYVERAHVESSSSSSFQSQAKTNEGMNLGSKLAEANKHNKERNSRDRCVQEADAAKQLGDEDFRGCQRVVEPQPNSFKVTLNNFEKDGSGQGDFAKHSWLVSSLVTRNGLLFDAASRPSSPFPGLYEHGSLHSRGIQASQSINLSDDLESSNALKELDTFKVKSGVSDEYNNGDSERLQPMYCRVELQTEAAPSKHEVQSPPWNFPEAKLNVTNHKNACIFEPSDNLLLEHLDVSLLIEDSALITNWELSSGELQSKKWGLQDQLPDVSSQEEGELPHFSKQTKQKHLENSGDSDSLDTDSSCSMVIFEVPSDDGTGPFERSSVVKGCCSSNGDKEFIYAIDNTDYDAKARLLQSDCCTDIEEIDYKSGLQSCFSSQFKLSKRLWSSTQKSTFERDSSMAGHLHDNDNDVDEVLLPRALTEMQRLQKLKNSDDDFKEDEHQPLLNASTESSETNNGVNINFSECSSVDEGNRLQSSAASFKEALMRQDSVEVFAFEDEMVATREKKSSAVSLSIEEENGEQRKKLRRGHSNSFERVQDSIPVVEVSQTQQTLAFRDCQESSLEARLDGLESSDSKQVSDESSFEQTSSLSVASPSSSHVQTPMVSYRSPARLADDRPILGTVAAHWSPITTKKWWDGKGIPNSTNKYKEDQKVNWHAIPFEVRLEQALAKQESVLSK